MSFLLDLASYCIPILVLKLTYQDSVAVIDAHNKNKRPQCTLISKCRAVFMLYLIERAKKCLDFSATVYIIHLLLCTLYGGFPSSITWWVVNGTGLAIMALLGEYLCIRRELREIPITRYRSSKYLSHHS